MMANLVTDVLARVKLPKRSLSWRDKLPQDIHDEVCELRRKYQSGELGDIDATSLARALKSSLEQRGIEMPAPHGIQRWLRDC